MSFSCFDQLLQERFESENSFVSLNQGIINILTIDFDFYT